MTSLLLGGLGTPELILILLVVVLLFGASKLPDLARDKRGIGKLADPDREIDAVLDKADHAIFQPQFARNLRIALQIG